MHEATRELANAMGVKLWKSQRLRLEAIQHERGHNSLNQTIREAVDDYIDRYDRERVAGSSAA